MSVAEYRSTSCIYFNCFVVVLCLVLFFILKKKKNSTESKETENKSERAIIFMFYFALFCVEPYLMRLAVTMFILGVGTSPGGKTRVNKSNTRNTGVAGISYNMAPLPGSIGRRSTISYDQAKTASSSTERTNDVPK